MSVQYYAWRLATVVLRSVPLPVAYAVADLCGRAGFAFSPRLRRNTLRNFRRVMPGAGIEELRGVARSSIANYCRYLVDFARYPERTPQDVLTGCIAGDAWEQLACETRHRGVVIAPMHFGNWDAGAAATMAAGFPVTVVADRFGDPRLDAAVFGTREALGMKVLPADRIGPELLRPLRRRELLALLVDKPTPGTGVRVPFFGRDVEVPAGPARIALRTGAAIVPCAFPRLRPGSPDIAILAEWGIDTRRTGDEAADVLRITGAVMAAHERFIRANPEQWYMFREMWPERAL